MLKLRNKSWKAECVGRFNMDWRILVFYPGPEAFVENVAHNVCYQWKIQSHSPAHVLMRLYRKDNSIARLLTKRKKEVMLELLLQK